MSGRGGADLRRLLDRTWYAFLGRFPRPTPIQEAGIPAILAGEPVLLAAATATGKTEAYAAPLLERLIREKWDAPGLLIVSPTRALTNDLYRRLEAPLATLGVPLARRTGDHAEWDDKKPGAVVVTTPESLDSLLARRPDALRPVRAIVLDELHVLDGTARGDQLAILVTRLEQVVLRTLASEAARGRGGVPIALQRVAATATVSDAAAVARRYLGPGARVVQTGERRQIEADILDAWDPGEVAGHLVRLAREAGRRTRKILVFANSRADAESLAGACRNRAPFGQDVFVHHASLSKPERERVEKRFLDAPTALCLATSTLELGIDIGDIDCVGLFGPPSDVASFLQRTGRGNRRAWDRTRVACFCRDAGQRVRFEHLLEKARSGDLGHASLGPSMGELFRPSVLVQQAFSLVFQNRQRFVDADSFAKRLPAWLREAYPAGRLEELLAHLAAREWLRPLAGGRYGADDRLERAFQRGTMHSNIGGEAPGIEVIDEATERVVGYLPASDEGGRGRRSGAASSRLGDGQEILLGGQRRTVRRVGQGKVRVASSGTQGTAEFKGKGSPAISLDLARSLAAHLGIGERTLVVVNLEPGLPDALEALLPGPRPAGRFVLAHFLGSAWGRIFTECLQSMAPGTTAAGNAFVTVVSPQVPEDLHFPESLVLGEIGRHRRALSAALGDGPLGPQLPEGWWVAWLQESLDVPRFLSFIDTFVVEERADAGLRDILASLAPRGSA